MDIELILPELSEIKWTWVKDRFKGCGIQNPEDLIHRHIKPSRWNFVDIIDDCILLEANEFRSLRSSLRSGQILNNPAITFTEYKRLSNILNRDYKTFIMFTERGLKFDNEELVTLLSPQLGDKLFNEKESLSALPFGLGSSQVVDKYIIPNEDVPYFYDYFTENFPLYQPTNPQIKIRKLHAYISRLYSRVKQYSNEIYISIITASEVNKAKYIENMENILAIASIQDFSSYFHITETKIVLVDTEDIYDRLWGKYVSEPLIRTQLAQYIPIEVPEIKDIVEQYYSESYGPLNPLYQEELGLRVKTELVLTSRLPIPDIRNIIDEYLDLHGLPL